MPQRTVPGNRADLALLRFSALLPNLATEAVPFPRIWTPSS